METIIDPTAKIHPTAYVNPKNVIIEKDVVIGPLTAIGVNGLYTERDYIIAGKKHRVDLEGKVIIREGVDIGSLTAVVLGSDSNGETIIEKNVIIGNCNNIGHDVRVGEESIIIVNATLLGHVHVGNRCRIGPSVTIRERVKIGDGATISMGAIVTRDVEPGRRVTGNFAIDHEVFIRDLKEKTTRRG